jgi:phosphate transport system substrate-binding protein
VRTLLALGGVLVLVAATGCGGGGGGTTQKSLSGAGSSLLAPLVSAWAVDYKKRTGVSIAYNAVGSGAGIQAITQRDVDFGASDAPMTAYQAKAAKDVLQVPWALSATALSYNVKGAPSGLKLSGPVLAGIFLGTITKWNDPAITKLNPGAQLPATLIAPVFRIDASGDTYAFTDFLSKVSPEWKTKVGAGTQVDFAAGSGARGNSGVTATISRTDGAIGYVAIAYAVQGNLSYASIQNAAGNFSKPDIPSIEAAAKTVTSIPPDNTITITDPPASEPGAYPISTFTYALVPESTSKASVLKPFLHYALGDGQSLGAQYQFAPLPDAVITAGENTIAKIHS